MQNLSLSGREAGASLIWSFGLKGVWRFGGAANFCRHRCGRESWSCAHSFGHLVTQIAATNWLHAQLNLYSRSTRELTVVPFVSALPYLVA
jgi:hypothetical protein